MSLYEATKSLVNLISEDIEDYPDSSAYRQMMDRVKCVQDELGKVAENMRRFDSRVELAQLRDYKANESWEDAILYDGDSEDVEIESDGWTTDGKHYSRTYYLSIDGKESTRHTYSITFENNSDIIIEE